MKTERALPIVLLYVFLWTLLTTYTIRLLGFVEIMGSVIDVVGESHFAVARKLLIGLSVLAYLYLLVDSYARIKKSSKLTRDETLFWQKILLLKPLSGITAFALRDSGTGSPRLIRATYYIRNGAFGLAVLCGIAVILLPVPWGGSLGLLFGGLYIAIITHFIFEPLIMLDAWRRDRKEWEESGYYRYFSSVKSILGYGEYFRKHFGKSGIQLKTSGK
jgi:hypothetical protein